MGTFIIGTFIWAFAEFFLLGITGTADEIIGIVISACAEFFLLGTTVYG